MQNPTQKFRQSSVVFKKSGILPKNLKILTSSNYPTVQSFLLELRTLFLHVSTKGCAGFFLSLFRSLVICENKKDLAPTHLFFTLLLITLDLNKIKTIPNTLF